ncbi:MAG: PIN domain-containing protein [Lachnospiraceae bacterium]|nr:PIN domain-containing protein [Lachnospiraceae bacterium]
MVILVDTNVVLDFLVVRKPYFDSAKQIIQLCAEEKIKGYIAFHSLPNIYYILHRDYGNRERRKMLERVCMVLQVTGASHEKVCDAILRESFKDFEDCLQDECAKEVGADYIITRNISDFSHSDVKAITPEEFLEIVKQ